MSMDFFLQENPILSCRTTVETKEVKEEKITAVVIDKKEATKVEVGCFAITKRQNAFNTCDTFFARDCTYLLCQSCELCFSL